VVEPAATICPGSWDKLSRQCAACLHLLFEVELTLGQELRALSLVLQDTNSVTV
jgi:hypothetical protein